MLTSGLVSVSFRQLSPAAILLFAAEAGLETIEWGGDVHVPPGDLEKAAEVGLLTREAGLRVAAYGSYYRADGSERFEPIFETALVLEAPLIRVWAGHKGSAQTSPEERAAVVRDLQKICERAQVGGLEIAVEYHGGTLTDTRQSCRALLDEVAHPNFKTLWQPLRRAIGDPKTDENCDDLRDVLPDLANVHVYNWVETTDGRQARPLSEGESWRRYVEILKGDGRERSLLLEFVPDNEPTILAREAAALRKFFA